MDQKPKGLLLITTGGTIAAEPYRAVPDKGYPTPEDVHVKDNSRVINYVKSITGERPYKRAMQRRSLGFNDHMTIAFHVQTRVEDFGTKDSKYIGEQDIPKIAKLIADAPENLVLITMGTDCMVQNSDLLRCELETNHPGILEKKRIVFTGAHRPLADNVSYEGTSNERPEGLSDRRWQDIQDSRKRLKDGLTDGYDNLNLALDHLTQEGDQSWKGISMVMQKEIFDPQHTMKEYDIGDDGRRKFSGRFIHIPTAEQFAR